MAKSNKAFLDLIINQRSQKKDKKFKGTFLDYLNLLRKDTSVVKLAHSRLRDAIEVYGTSCLNENSSRCRRLFDGEKVKVYEYFSSEFFGMEQVTLAHIQHIMQIHPKREKLG